ncbi:MAG: hypothetical protein ACJAY7_001291 [Pseudohongiellaceae bacterium]|jgi:hypothetical protein
MGKQASKKTLPAAKDLFERYFCIDSDVAKSTKQLKLIA